MGYCSTGDDADGNAWEVMVEVNQDHVGLPMDMNHDEATQKLNTAKSLPIQLVTSRMRYPRTLTFCHPNGSWRSCRHSDSLIFWICINGFFNDFREMLIVFQRKNRRERQPLQTSAQKYKKNKLTQPTYSCTIAHVVVKIICNRFNASSYYTFKPFLKIFRISD